MSTSTSVIWIGLLISLSSLKAFSNSFHVVPDHQVPNIRVYPVTPHGKASDAFPIINDFPITCLIHIFFNAPEMENAAFTGGSN
jgi:hypothetical protein